VVEAMKMLNDLRCRVDGVVAAVNAAAGQRVDIGAPLIEIVETSNAAAGDT
jgi:biotin carboxyl carrier protein